ncbi:competence/damage-inducible protein A [Paenibacillus larvae]|uniref:competence/damage-inducible protein A n=1 Tax=Paenibacillus larvae TaxID=1464 RepID=UPI0001F8592B|nr:competence/damage-inducible protein A [Paenibacillus larvae]AQR76667.1 competence/damage-inducible protein A [Paenibacillus larvae subsp. larvae]AVF22470.1 putative competence-damage inducible protein CinA [Paenibacillus larvae subsp. larvae]ETK26682.1 putative competence-damage inducible protein CinA [Paenibacillus larvae subsp. larvae DSM 25719]MCY7476857.1 competence/damage-inducible protein A [Paenibacillus larvae]MCY7490476.1 competence/damage-inducible protein A [Paenibacillus larvae]
MKAEIIAIGTELLLGQIVNTNAQYLAHECASMGIHVYFQTVVGDNRQRLLNVFKQAAGRADLIICTGGLGPTQDDLTKEVLGEMLGRKIFLHEPSLQKIARQFKDRGIHMVESNKRQALTLEGARNLENKTGLAIGTALTDKDTHYLLLPGPPREMKPMFEHEAKPWLLSIMGEKKPLFSRMLKFAGIGESALEDRLIELIQTQSDPTIAPYAKEGEVTIRVTTSASSKEETDRIMQPTIDEISRRLNEHMYAATGSDITVEEAVINLLRDKEMTLATAESCTGGMLGDMITANAGSGDVYVGGIVSYSNEMKQALLGIDPRLLEGSNAPGAVSSDTARSMAENMRNLSGADVAVSTTGVAGPAEQEGKPVGLVYVGIAFKEAPTEVVKLQLSGGRETIKIRTAKSAFYHVWKHVKRM